MSLMAMANNLFMLFVCLELASLSSYLWGRSTRRGRRRGGRDEYFIVGSVVSA
ncbi:MAG: hypothetical protein Ct9H300mP30_2140 [Methanobacteriota archaeon]|nr:MAG: hypothetical protein Ct9H300mP30_2140 [Euryarchaeota archaeon]